MALFWTKVSSALWIGIASKHKGDFYCLNSIYFCKTKNQTWFTKKKKKLRKKDFYDPVMPSEDTKILDFKQ